MGRFGTGWRGYGHHQGGNRQAQKRHLQAQTASIALDFGADEDQAIAALLHDVLEDSGPHYASEILRRFGERVLTIVEGCTDGVPDATGRKQDWTDRKTAYLAHLSGASDDVILVSGSDKLHNARAIVHDLQTIGPIVFERFTSKKDGTLWYYNSLVEIFEQRNARTAKAFGDVVSQMAGLSGS